MPTKNNNEPKLIQVSGPQIRKMLIVVKGTSPLMTNRMTERAMGAIAEGQSGAPSPQNAPREPEREFFEAVHRTHDGRHGVGSWQFGKALEEGGYRVLGEKMTIINAVVSVKTDDPEGVLPIEGPEPQMDVRWGRLNGRTATILYRPRYWPWRLTLPIWYLKNKIREEDVLNLIMNTGFAIGVGAGRRIGYGRFDTVSVDGVPFLPPEAVS